MKEEIGYALPAVLGFCFGFVVFAIAFNSPSDELSFAIWPLYVLLPAITLVFSLERGADSLVVFSLVNGPPSVVWCFVIPNQIAFFVPVLVIGLLSGLAVAAANFTAKLRSRPDK